MEDFQYFVCPLTGEAVRADVDSLAGHWTFLVEQSARTKLALHELARALQRMSPGESGTERLRGETCRVKLEQSPLSWNQASLREVCETFPDLAEGVVMPTHQLRVSLREYDKILRENGDARFSRFKQRLQAACLGRTAPPRVSVEHLKSGDSHVGEHTVQESPGDSGGAVPAGEDSLEAPGG